MGLYFRDNPGRGGIATNPLESLGNPQTTTNQFWGMAAQNYIGNDDDDEKQNIPIAKMSNDHDEKEQEIDTELNVSEQRGSVFNLTNLLVFGGALIFTIAAAVYFNRTSQNQNEPQSETSQNQQSSSAKP
jgi:hypothetical protein